MDGAPPRWADEMFRTLARNNVPAGGRTVADLVVIVNELRTGTPIEVEESWASLVLDDDTEDDDGA